MLFSSNILADLVPVNRYTPDPLPILLSIFIPMVLFGIPAVLALIEALRQNPARDLLRNAKVLVLLGLGFVLPAVLGTGAWLIRRAVHGDFNEVHRNGEHWVLRHSIKGTRHRVRRDRILRAELKTRTTSHRTTATFHWLRLHLADGSHLDSERCSYRPNTEQAICALGLVVKDVTCKPSPPPPNS